MRKIKKEEEKRVKLSITVLPELNKKMERDTVNKSKLIEKLLIEYYDKKSLY